MPSKPRPKRSAKPGKGRTPRMAYSEGLAEEICRRLSLGESMARICQDDSMPSQDAVYGWLNRHAAFVERYVRARQLAVESSVDAMHDIADSVRGCTDNAVVNAARLAIDTRRWTASKLMPHKYGDRLDVQADSSVTVRIVHGLGVAPIEPPTIEGNVVRLPKAD